MTIKSIDVIIVGMEPGGLIAGALLVKRGMSALVCDLLGKTEDQPHPGIGSLQATNLLTGFGINGPFQEMFQELGVPFLQKKRFQLAEPAFQVVMPDHRMDVHQDRSKLFETLGKEFPQERGRLERFLQHIDNMDRFTREFLARVPPFLPSGLSDRLKTWRRRKEFLKSLVPSADTTLSELLDKYELQGPARTFLEATAGMLSDIKINDPPLIQAGRALGYTNRKLYRTEGINNLLLQITRERIATLRGRFCRVEKIGDMVHERGGQILMKLKGLPDEYKTRYVLWNTEPVSFLDSMPGKTKRGVYGRRRRMDYTPPAFFSLFIKVSERVLPVGMMDDVALVPDADRPARGENLLTVTLFPPEIPSTGERIIQIGCLPDTDRPLNEKGLGALADQMHTALEYLIPFLDRYIVSDMKKESIEAFLSDRYSHTLPWSDPEDELGIRGLPIETPQDDILYAGRETLPGMGMEGYALTGLRCAELVRQRQLR